MGQKKVKLLGLEISTRSLGETVEWISKNTGTVYCCTLNEVMMAEEEKSFKKILERGDLLTADGMPLVWWMKFKTGRGERVYGPELLNKLLIANYELRIKHLFIGDRNNKKYFKKYGDYLVLPYKDKFEESDYEMMVEEIKKSGAKVVWIGLGTEKQIIAADELRKRLPDRVYVTVGAAFDFLSGNKKQAPKWLRNAGGEWLFRLIMEPKRLGKRYLKMIFFLGRYVFNCLFHAFSSQGKKVTIVFV
jgi:N-acetylglucosaminyldiphosphoundecaprenol N-acetyl-beta-D-mannosaminyltransferase